MCHPPEIWGPRLASELYLGSDSSGKQVEVLQWMIRGSREFCCSVDANRQSYAANGAQIAQATANLVAAGSDALSKIRPWQLTGHTTAAHKIAWLRVLSTMNIPDQGVGLPCLAGQALTTTFSELKSASGEEQALLVKGGVAPMRYGSSAFVARNSKWLGWSVHAGSVVKYFEAGVDAYVGGVALVAYTDPLPAHEQHFGYAFVGP
ncbi:hypothetical protein WJX73_005216 [Symbiochloris irregularis]|uniref:Uncharacterized protein n=1 Tax=Symbiochloris irregularis TaxID=706552 RepID=A0AAW1NPA8_9CHLO